MLTTLKCLSCRGILVLVLLAAAAAAFAEDTYVTVASGTAQTLSLQNDGSYSVRIPLLTRDGGPLLAMLEFTGFDVQYKEARTAALLAAFTITKEPATQTHDDALVITCSGDLSPGSYVITLHVAPTGDKKKPQSLVLTISKPAPLVTPGSSLYIERTSALFGNPEVIPGRLRLTEDSRAAALSSASLSWDIDHRPGTHASAGQLDLPSEAIHLNPGQSRDYLIGLRGDFPPGTYSGKITVRGAQLSAPISVNFDLLSRRSPNWLIVLAGVGAALGFLVRVALKTKLDTDQALISASLTLQTLQQARARIEETDLRQKIDEQIQSLTEAQEGHTAATINGASTTAASALQSIETQFQQRRSAFEPKLATLDALLAKRWILPPETAAVFATVVTARDAVAAALARGNIFQANELLRAATKEPLLDAVTKGMKWRAAFAAYLAAFQAQQSPLGADALQKVHAAAASAAAQVPTDLHPSSTDVPSADAELTRTHGAFTGGQDFFAAVGAALRDFLEQAQTELAEGIAADATDWKPIEDATRALCENLRTALHADLDAATQQLRAQGTALAGAWSAMLKKSLPAEAFATVKESISHGSWDAAIAQAVESFAANAPHLEVAGVPETVQAVGLALGTPLRLALPLPNLGGFPELLEQRSSVADFVLTGSVEERRRLRNHSAWVELAQTIIVALLFVAGVYALNADTWIGTSKEMFTIFLLAFGADLSAEGVLALLKK
jgi:hypothetical protein